MDAKSKTKNCIIKLKYKQPKRICVILKDEQPENIVITNNSKCPIMVKKTLKVNTLKGKN